MATGIWGGAQEASGRALAMGMNIANFNALRNEAAERIAIQQGNAAVTGAREERLARSAEEANRIAAAKIPQHQKRMDPSMVAMSEAATRKSFGDAGYKAFRPLFDTVKEIVSANPESTFGDAYEAAKSAYPSIREQMVASLEKELTSGKLSPVEQRQVQSVYDAMVYDQTGDNILGNGVFKNTARSMKMEQENSKAAINEARQAGITERAQMTDARVREMAEENRQLRRDLASQRELGKNNRNDKDKEKAPKTPTGIDFKRLNDMIAKANEKPDGPESDDIEMISGAADKLGYAYVPYEEKGQLRGVPGTSMFDFRTGAKKGYKLVSVKTPDDVKKAFQQGLLTEEQATGILQSKHGFK